MVSTPQPPIFGGPDDVAGPGRRGPAPAPVEDKRRRGNPGKHALPAPIIALAPVSRLPAGRLPDSGEALIEQILDGPASTWIADPDRLALLQLLRDGWDERLRLREAIDNLGDEWINGRYTPAVFLRLERVEKGLTTWLSLLGLTPSDRSRLGVAEVKARSRLEGLRARRDAARNRAG
jgi:hypothetical protein